MFVCDPSIFERVDDYSTLWRDTTTGYLYLGPLTSEICPPGVKVVSAEHLARPMHFTVILCPEVLTQTPGQHKMFAGVDGLELSHTRNSEDANGNEDALDLFAWLDMSIDELRQHVLSVWMGRVIMYIQGRKFEKIVDNQGRTEGYLWSEAESKSLLLTSIRLTILQSHIRQNIAPLAPQRLCQRIGPWTILIRSLCISLVSKKFIMQPCLVCI